ncbi:hypothetical protein Sango_2086900 [Sesamum angolense]|uniref:Reverse transcriptase domain-containing protein n=1 Tax=Sesamum angolense TaxID=2727404 RepID=A0AAE1WBE3_9LAMI|nr:hypothetical protein Sango_2086900 [Sesamum angolense]
MIANRPIPVFDSILSPSQSTFIQGILIIDNVLLAFELNHYLRSSRQSQGGCVALKLDRTKAYDRVGWMFLWGVLLWLGVSLLLFSDDNLVFCKATEEEIGEVRWILRLYAPTSRQNINLQRFSMAINRGVPRAVKHFLGALLGV